jgi:hypothetical protein
VIEIKAQADEDVKREPLFAVVSAEGDAKPYDHPITYPPAVGLNFIHLARTRGEGVALDWLMMWALGADGHAALRSAHGMTDDQCADIAMAIRTRALSGSGSGPKP